MGSNERSDAEVIAESVGLPQSFALIFDRHVDAVHRFVSYRVGDAEIDDVVSEVFRIAFEERGRFDPAAPSAKPWLLGIATNLARRHHRSVARGRQAVARSARQHTALVDPLLAVDRRLDAAESVADAAWMIDRLADGEREVLLMIVWDELTPTEVAQALGIPAATVRTRLHRARNALRHAFTVDAPRRDS